MQEYVVYMLKCRDGSFYVGLTSDPDQRIEQHASAAFVNSYTSSRLPAHLVYQSSFTEVTDAIAWERRLKRWSHKKKEALMRRDEDALKKAAVCGNESNTLTVVGRERARIHRLIYGAIPRLRSG